MADQDISIQFGGVPYVLRVRAGKYFMGGGITRFGTQAGTPPLHAYTMPAAFRHFALTMQTPTAQWTPAGGGGAPGKPQRIFSGVTDTSSALIYWWGPPEQVAWRSGTVDNGTPDHYIVYRDDGAGGAFSRVYGDTSIWSATSSPPGKAGVRDAQVGTQGPQPFYVDTTLSNSTTYRFYVTAVSSSGVEGPASDIVSVTTLALSTGAPTLPAPTINPDTWIQPYSLPLGGTRWLATNTTADTTLVIPGTTTSGPAPWAQTVTGCSFLYALQRCNQAGGDIIVLTAGANYTQPIGGGLSSGWVTGKYTGANGWTYIISDQDPDYRAAAGLSAGTLPPSTYDPTPVQFQHMTLTGALSAGATSATLTLPWTRRTGAHYVIFTTTDPLGEERLVKFTQGSTTINWTSWNDTIDSNYQRVGPGLLSAATVDIRVAYVNCVTPVDLPAMPHLLGNIIDGIYASAFNIQADTLSATNKLRLVGINITYDPANTKVNSHNIPFYTTDSIGFLNVRPPTGNTSLAPIQNIGCESVYVDRCIWGSDSTNTDYRHQAHGIVSINCDHFLATQSWCWGISTGGSPDGDNGYADGGPSCFQNCYIECESENLICGGLYASETRPIHDLVWRYNHSHKPSFWKSALEPNRNQRWGSPFIQDANPIPISGATAANPIVITTSTPTNIATNGLVKLAGFTTGSWTALNNTIQVVTVVDTAHFSIPVDGHLYTGATTGGTAQLQQIMVNQIKNLLETKGVQFLEAYGNLHYNCWVSGQVGYNASAFQHAPNGSPGATNFNSGYPWQVVTDVHIHDNMNINVGSGLFAFTPGYMVANYAARIAFVNNVVLGAPTPAGQNAIRPIYLEGPVPDLTLDRNTFIINSTITWPGKGANATIWNNPGGPGTQAPQPKTPHGLNQYQDRMTVTNNIMDGPLAFQPLTPALPLTGYPNLTWTANLTILDPTTTYPPTTYAQVPYTSIGFKAWVDNTMPPLHPQDWNVVGGTGCNGVTCSTVSTSGGPIGATVKSVTLSLDPFPRTYWQVIAPVGGGGYNNTTFYNNAAKFNIVNPGPYMQIEQNMGTTFATIFKAIKAQAMVNGISNRCIHYVMSDEQSTVGGGGNAPSYTVWSSWIDTANWWIRGSVGGYPTGPIAISSLNANTGVFAAVNGNNVTNGTVNSGRTAFQSFWDHYDGVLRQGRGTAVGYASGVSFAANPYLDGYQMDNVFCQPRTAGSYGMDTTIYAVGNATAAALMQQGQAKQIAAIKALNPGMVVMCNSDYYVHTTNTYSNVVTLDPTQKGLMDIVYCQGTIGATYSLEGQGGNNNTAPLMANLIAAEAQRSPGGTLIFECEGRSRTVAFTSTSQASWVAADWQTARFGLGCTCMRNWHFALNNREDYRPDRPYFMDEFLAQNGVYGWLGHPVDLPQTGPRFNGVWYRVFQGGVVFMNPNENTARTINLSSDLGLTGLSAIAQASPTPYGDASINTGNPVTSITIQPRDGRFLIYT